MQNIPTGSGMGVGVMRPPGKHHSESFQQIPDIKPGPLGPDSLIWLQYLPLSVANC